MMKYEGLRDWLSIIEQRGELTMLEDVDWNLEMGAVVDVLYREHPPYSRAGSATIYCHLDQTALSRPCQASRPDRVAMFFRRVSESLYHRRRRRYRSDPIDDVVWAL